MFTRRQFELPILLTLYLCLLSALGVLLLPACSDAQQSDSVQQTVEDVSLQTDAKVADVSLPLVSKSSEPEKELPKPIAKRSSGAVTPVDADAALVRFDHEYLSDTFAAVADDVAFEPYAGVLRGAKGTALAGSGNAVDQTLLLASALDGHVSAWRIARGTLSASNVSAILATIDEPQPGNVSSRSSDPNLYDPISDEHFRKVTADHFWLEVQREAGDEWLALDPTFPGANFGASFANGKQHLDAPTAAMKQRIELRFMQQTADGKRSQLGKIVGDVADLALYPIVLVARGIPQLEGTSETSAEPEGDLGLSGGGLLGGGGGGLFGGGGASAPVEEPKVVQTVESGERKIVGTEYRRELTFGGDEPQFITATQVVDNEPSSRISREWIEFTLQVPGFADRKLERDLFDARLDGDSPAVVRRYSIALITGKVSEEMFEGYRARLDLDQINNAQTQLATLKEQPASNELALDIIKLESASALTPHLINLAFGFESDELTARLAMGAGINVIRDIPRILITTVETSMNTDGSANTKTTLDLRLDEVRAVPKTGLSTGKMRLFQRARGMQESSLEGRLLARFVQNPDDIVTTTRIMHAAQSQGKRLVLAAPTHRSVLDDVAGLPDRVLTRMNAALDAGHQIIAPAGAAVISGVQHWGWWDVDPETGAFVGVMDGGQHQSMSQYTITLEELALNDGTAFVIGGIVGATATLTLYSARMLEYGRMTPNMLEEVARGIESLTCVTCPRYDVRVTAAYESSTESQCEEKDGVSVGIGRGVTGEISFCENYKRGISCAASLMLGTYEVKETEGFVTNATFDLGPLSCKK